MNFLLSICIPTRDRVDSIKDNIDHLIAEIQENKLQNIIQVIISDNSHDLNESLKNKSSIFNFLTYVHSQDLGHDYNILNLSNCKLNRNTLVQLAIRDNLTFLQLVKFYLH